MKIIKNGTLLQFNPPRVKKGIDILIDGSTIRKVETGISIEKDYTVIDATGRYVMPGIVCSHNHFYSGLARGILADIKPSHDFVSVLRNLWWRLDRAIDDEILYYSGLISSLEAVRSGTTAVIDHHASPSLITGSLNTLRRTFEEVGLRGITCYEVTDRNGKEQMYEGIEENQTFALEREQERQQDGENHLVEGMIGGHAPFTISNDGLEAISDVVRKTGRGFHCHVAEDAYDGSWSHHRYGQDTLERLQDFGLLNGKAIVVHGVYLTDRDIEILNETDSFLVHNPRSNMNNNVGYNNNLDRIKNVALGTDGIGSDMFEELKFAFFKHRDSGGPLWPDTFLKFLDQGNVLLERNFGRKFGRIEEGYTADLVICNYRSPTPLVRENIPGHMAFGMSGRDVETVIINGRIKFFEGAFPFEVESIYTEARKAAGRLWKAMDSLR